MGPYKKTQTAALQRLPRRRRSSLLSTGAAIFSPSSTAARLLRQLYIAAMAAVDDGEKKS